MTVAYPRKLNNSMSARDILKRVVEDREIQLITLNRYRYNEQRSCKDLTDLIEWLNGHPKELVQELSHHVSDEARHAMWLTDLLVDLGADIGKPPGISYIDEFERLLDPDAYDSESKREEGIINVLASINVTENGVGTYYFFNSPCCQSYFFDLITIERLLLLLLVQRSTKPPLPQKIWQHTKTLLPNQVPLLP